jgi:hypothetical protein
MEQRSSLPVARLGNSPPDHGDTVECSGKLAAPVHAAPRIDAYLGARGHDRALFHYHLIETTPNLLQLTSQYVTPFTIP